MVCDERSAAIALALCPALEPSTLRRLVYRMGGALAVWDGTREEWQAVCRVRSETVQRLDAWRRSCTDSNLEEKLAARGIHCLLPGDPAFPRRLLELPDPPVVLFAAGEAEAVTERPSAAVVGTRRASAYGLEAAAWVSETLARAGCSVVSGLAVGIDAAAHEACLNAGGLSAAVLGCGVDSCYPPSHRRLYERIRSQGVLFSEYAPGTPVAKHHFPERNRLIAALGQVTIVVQAGERSGALRTVDAALEIGRDVWVVPGPITSVHFRGSHRLLQDGAQLLVDPVDCLNALGLQAPAGRVPDVPDRWRPLYDALCTEQTASDLAVQLGVDPGKVYAGLLELELLGLVRRTPGGLYRRLLS